MSAIEQSHGAPSTLVERRIEQTARLDVFSQRLRRAVAMAMKMILVEGERRRVGRKDDIKLLNSGVWRDRGYAQALRDTNQARRLGWFKDRDHFYFGYTPPNTFTKEGIYQFKICKGMKPSEAIKKTMQGLSILNSTNVCQLAQYYGLLSVWGEEKFNRIFESTESELKLSHYNDQSNPLLFVLSSPYHGSETPPTLEVGQKVGFVNHPLYTRKHAEIGETTVINTIYLGEGQFGALGLSGGGRSGTEIERFLVDEYNLDPRAPTELYSRDLIKKMKTPEEGVDFPDQIDREVLLEAKKGIQVFAAIDFNMPLVHAIRGLPLKEVASGSLLALKVQHYLSVDLTKVNASKEN